MEIVKDKHPYCPQCGRKRGVTLRKKEHDDIASNSKVEYFICCKNCHVRFKIINCGIWLKTETTKEKELKTKTQKHDWRCKCLECETDRKTDANLHEMTYIGGWK